MDVSQDVPAGAAPQNSIVLCWIGKAFLSVVGWRIEGDLPPVDRAVIIAEPHTSYWDAVFMLAVAWGMRIRLSWMVKHTAFRWPFGGVMRWLGAVPIDRRARQDTVGQIKTWFESSDRAWLAIAPSGTRSKRDHWKSGFYQIARSAQVPVLLGFLDFGRKRGGIGGLMRPTNNTRADMDVLREFYADIRGYRPEQQSVIRLRDEGPEVAT